MLKIIEQNNGDITLEKATIKSWTIDPSAPTPSKSVAKPELQWILPGGKITNDIKLVMAVIKPMAKITENYVFQPRTVPYD